MSKERTDPLIRNLRKLVANRAEFRRKQRELYQLRSYRPEYF